MFRSLAITLCIQFLLPCTLQGNDGAAEIALGGIRLKQERRVAMVKERLFISKKKVRVEYEFLNESKEDVTTEVAFPLPEYFYDGFVRNMMRGINEDKWTEERVTPFKVWVDGLEARYSTEVTAKLGKQDITAILNNYKIRIDTFGDFEQGINQPDKVTQSTSQMDKLSIDQLGKLVAMGAIKTAGIDASERNAPCWTVHKTHHWNQVFPAGKILKIAHEYQPHLGIATDFYIEDMLKPSEFAYNLHAEPACPSEEWIRMVRHAIRDREAKQPAHISYHRTAVSGRWVRYILTTANTWKTPIHDFELVVEDDPDEFVSFCWDGPIEKFGANTFRARLKDFIPSKELTVYFLQP